MIRSADAILRGERIGWPLALTIGIACGAIYGAAMGLYGGRGLQALFSAIKVPILLFAATLVVLPNFFVVNTLLGLRDDFGEACRGVLGTQACVAVALGAWTPITVFGYVSVHDYASAMVVNGIAFVAASFAGHLSLRAHYRPLIARDPRHRVALRAWLLLYVFVAIQLAWMLRPFVGHASFETAFVRGGLWGNAYEAVFDAVRKGLLR